MTVYVVLEGLMEDDGPYLPVCPVFRTEQQARDYINADMAKRKQGALRRNDYGINARELAGVP